MEKTLAAQGTNRDSGHRSSHASNETMSASTFPRTLPKYRWISYVNIFIYIYTGWGPSSLAKLVQITIITIVYDTQITIFRWVYKPTYNWGAPSCIYIYMCVKIYIIHSWEALLLGVFDMKKLCSSGLSSPIKGWTSSRFPACIGSFHVVAVGNMTQPKDGETRRCNLTYIFFLNLSFLWYNHQRHGQRD